MSIDQFGEKFSWKTNSINKTFYSLSSGFLQEDQLTRMVIMNVWFKKITLVRQHHPFHHGSSDLGHSMVISSALSSYFIPFLLFQLQSFHYFFFLEKSKKRAHGTLKSYYSTMVQWNESTSTNSSIYLSLFRTHLSFLYFCVSLAPFLFPSFFHSFLMSIPNSCHKINTKNEKFIIMIGFLCLCFAGTVFLLVFEYTLELNVCFTFEIQEKIGKR